MKEQMPNEVNPIATIGMDEAQVKICNDTITKYEKKIRELSTLVSDLYYTLKSGDRDLRHEVLKAIEND